jgi:hypothetical protein
MRVESNCEGIMLIRVLLSPQKSALQVGHVQKLLGPLNWRQEVGQHETLLRVDCRRRRNQIDP